MVNSLYEDSLLLQGGGMMTMDESSSSSPNDSSSLLVQTVGDPASMNVKVLNFLFLGCEPQMPYGPIDHTAQLVLDTLAQALTEAIRPCRREQQAGEADLSYDDTYWMLRMQTYNVQKQEYPATSQEWDQYDGIVLPGSFSAAYDNEPWIQKLCQVIQTEIVPKQRKTLGICFGHQILAHSFADGLAAKMPSGARGGRYTLQTTAAGKALLGQAATQNYFYTHGDYVQQLPASAVCLGGDEQVPILAAAYYCDDNSSSNQPYAITFQAHPEYASSMDLGLYRTLHMILNVMTQKGALTAEQQQAACQDAMQSFTRVQQDSLETMVMVGRLLGWW